MLDKPCAPHVDPAVFTLVAAGARNVSCAGTSAMPMLDVEEMEWSETGNARVLVVEDDRALGELVATALGAEGHAIAVARRGATALGLLERDGVPDVVLLDLGLPDMTADEFARRYRALPGPHAPLVVVTGVGAEEATEATERLGAAGFLTKPFDLDALLALVQAQTHDR